MQKVVALHAAVVAVLHQDSDLCVEGARRDAREGLARLYAVGAELQGSLCVLVCRAGITSLLQVGPPLGSGCLACVVGDALSVRAFT